MKIAIVAALCLMAAAAEAGGQPFTQRGFAEARATLFPQDTATDTANLIGDLLVREDVFAQPAAWLQLAAGGDVRANSHDQVDASWRVDFRDRGSQRPALSIRRLSATIARGPLTLDVGKQFIRWGKTDIVTPTDRFAPRDFVTVTDAEFIAVTGARGALQLGSHSVDVVVVPRMTPSRTPLLGQRWTPVASGGGPITFHELPARFPTDVQIGVRYSRTATALDYSVSFFNGSNHLPNVLAVPGPSPTEVGVMKEYPDLRAYGGDAAVPTKWFIAKAEGAYFTSTSPMTDEYVLYVLQVERQVGEWLLIGGYAGQHVTERRLGFSFAPDRGLTESIVARLSYTIDSNRSAAFESAVRQDGGGLYVKGEYSHARGQHWRATAAVTIIRGDETDFLGQYRRNSNAAVSARYSF